MLCHPRPGGPWVGLPTAHQTLMHGAKQEKTSQKQNRRRMKSGSPSGRLALVLAEVGCSQPASEYRRASNRMNARRYVFGPVDNL